MIFINTRPASRAKPLTDFLQSQAVNVLELPLLELVACELSKQEKHYLNQIKDYHALIFISETAVSYFFNFIHVHRIRLKPNLPIIAVGQKTAQTINNFWQENYSITPNLSTPSDFNLPENNEGLLQLPSMQSLKNGDKILMLKGKDGRDLLQNTLLAKGVQVDKADFYQRIFPPLAEHIFQKFCQSDIFLSKKIVLITSLTAWRHWQQLCEKFEVDSGQFYYLVLQSRIFNHLCQTLPKQQLIEIENLYPKTIFLALQHFDKIAHL